MTSPILQKLLIGEREELFKAMALSSKTSVDKLKSGQAMMVNWWKALLAGKAKHLTYDITNLVFQQMHLTGKHCVLDKIISSILRIKH